MSNSGNNPNDAGPGGGSSRRRRSTRHFGPSAGQGESAAGAKMSGQQGGDRPQRTGEKDNRPDQPARPKQQARQTGPNQRQGNPSGKKRGQQQGPQRPGQQPRRQNQPQQRQPQNKPQAKAARETADGNVKAGSRQQPESREARASREARDRTARQAQNQRVNRWEKRIKAEETYEDVKRENDRIEKEIWLEIAGIHTIKLDM